MDAHEPSRGPRRPSHATITAALALVGFVVVAVWSHRSAPFPGDEWGLRWIADPQWNAPQIGPMVRFMDLIAEPGLAVISVVIAVLAWRRAGRREAIAVFAGACAVLVSGIAKDIIGPTPFAVEHDLFWGKPGLPSGHVVWAVTFYGTIGWIAWRRRYRELAVACLAVVLAMGPARVLGGVHLVSDVVAGYLFGLAWAAAVIIWLERARRPVTDAT
ncbi:MAG: phosphatase PAP2 family protein [Solirubrobacteraceae bacterium]